MGSLLFEAYITGQWRELQTLWVRSGHGSVSCSLPGGGRDVIVFSCAGEYSQVCRSVAGADDERGGVRVAHTAGLEDLATLRDGESYTMDVVSDSGRAYTARWRHLAGA